MNHIDSSTISALENIHPISAAAQDKIMCALADELFECEYRENHFAVFFPGSDSRNIETECAFIWLEKHDTDYTWRWTVALKRWWMFWFLLSTTVEEGQEEPDIAVERLKSLLEKLFDELGGKNE